MMFRNQTTFLAALLLMLSGAAFADKYHDTAELFRNAGASSAFFGNSYGYAVFPTIGKAAFVIGGAHGKGRVYVHGNYVGDTAVTQLSLGFQLGGQGFSQIIFFEDERAFREFSTGNFEFSGNAEVVAVTAGASARASTVGASAGASGGKRDATTAGSNYYRGMAVFTIAKAGLMYEVSLAGQKFSYDSVSGSD